MVIGAFCIGCVQWDENGVVHDVRVTCARCGCGYDTPAVAGFLSLAKWS